MAEFTLKKGSDTYLFDTAGKVKKNSSNFGTWTVMNDAKCRLMAVKSDGGTKEAFDVEWKFNESNQLCLQQGGTLIFNFNAAPDSRPAYATRNSVLLVRPVKSALFQFELRGEWDMDENHNLSVTINTTKSALKGFIFDTSSKFLYHFFCDTDHLQKNTLGFTGQWEPFVDPVDGKARLRFKYKRENGTEDIFELPKALAIDHATNQFLYESTSANRRHRILFSGILVIGDNLELSYTIDRQVAQNGDQLVAQTTFRVGAVFHRQNFDGDVELLVKKQDGTAGTTTLTLRSDFTAVLGQVNLQVGFSFSQVRGGVSTPRATIGFEGKLTWVNGTVFWQFARNATTTTISIVAEDIRIGQIHADARLNIQKNTGGEVGVQFLLGVSF